MAFNHRVTVEPLPEWLDLRRFLGDGDWHVDALADGSKRAVADLERADAADLGARLRGLAIAGRPLQVDVRPRLERRHVRRARLEDARRRRDITPGFTRKRARLDEEGRRSLTPESLALAVAERANVSMVVDACCGCGGNAIGFARAGARVVAIDLDPARVELARHNARVYGVADRIEFVCGDALEVVAERTAELLFVDVPWGDWDRSGVDLGDLPLLAGVLAVRHRYPRTWLKLPPAFAVDTLDTKAVSAVFGEAPGDFRRIKFVLAEL